jgi:hypothetical protein
MNKCDLQSIRNLRRKDGETNLGEKAIIFCDTCKTGHTSEDIAIALLCRVLGRQKVLENGILPTYKDAFWEKNGFVSKAFIHAEILLLKESIPSPVARKRNSPFRINSDVLSVVGVLRNLHKTMHPQQCFKTKKNSDCRMKLPDCEKVGMEIHYDKEDTPWYDWKGIKNGRKLFLLTLPRGHADMYANTHNEHVTSIFHCNNNVVACVDGGSPMYCTAYHSKNTQKEDNEKAGKAAKVMIQRMSEKQKEGEMVTEENLGIKAMIGAILLSTDAHVCGAPMAAYLARNESRFWFSHGFSYTQIEDFIGESCRDYELESDKEGNPYMKSHVANYTMRPRELEELCLYDFLCLYTVARRGQGSLRWFGDHPSKDRLAVKILSEEKRRIPRVNFLDFVDSRLFEGEDIINCTIPQLKEARHHAMEEFSKKASILFIPFRDVCKDCMLYESFHLKFQQYVRDGRLPMKHSAILANIQNCRNSLNAGRPTDFLERHTSGVAKIHNQCSDVQKANDDIMSEILDDLMNDEGIFCEMTIPRFRNGRKQLTIASIQTIMLGRNSCGKKYCITPKINIPLNTSVIQERDNICSNEVMDCQFDLSKLNTLALSELITTQRNRTVTGESNQTKIPAATGTLENIQEYADVVFGEDEEQKQAFECIVASFVLKIYSAARKNDADNCFVSAPKRRKMDKLKHQLEKVNRGDQLICFLSGPGGSGKSAVIKAVTSYAKYFCVNLGIGFNSRVVVVTAITGAAAVSIRGGTTSKALGLNKKTTNFSDHEIEDWNNTLLVIIDEVSFSNRNEIEKADINLRALKENGNYKFGGVDVVFAGDFSQLTPVQGKPIYLEKDFIIWDDWVHTFLELKTNHRFKKDPVWGRTLSRYREFGPTENDIQAINSRIINSAKGPSENDIPNDVTYATKTNVDRMAINDGIFASHIRATHSTNPTVLPPEHTICIKAGKLQWWKSISPRKKEYKEFNELSKDILYACVGEAHVKSSGNSKTHDPLLKLYFGRPLMINDNLDVKKCIANGTMCEFQSVVLKEGITVNDLDIIVIDGFYVRSVEVSQIKSMKVKILDGLDSDDEVRMAYSKPQDISGGQVYFPLILGNEIDKKTPRFWRGIRMEQFPVNTANARTIHKLQGRSLENVLIHSWDYTGNWIYVALSRVREMTGLFLCQPLDHAKCKGMSREVRQFMEKLGEKRPGERLRSPTIRYCNLYCTGTVR